MKFEKWQALGNDYLIIEAAALPWEPTPERLALSRDPHFGPGSDGILLLSPVEDPAYVAELRIFNPDGSEAGPLRQRGAGGGHVPAALRLDQSADEFTIITRAGPITPTIRSENGSARSTSGRASTTSADYPSGPDDGRGELEAGGRRWAFQHVSIGNPQVRDRGLRRARVSSIWAPWAGDRERRAFPNRTNVSSLPGGGRSRSGPDLRAGRRGDALIGHRVVRRRRRR